MNRNIILCGVGGQGTVLASSSVFSHIRLGEGVNTPMIGLGQADLILGFELGETVRQLPYLKEGGKVIAADKAVMPVTASLAGGYDPQAMRTYLQQHVADLKIVEVEEAFQTLHSTKVLNLLLLGSALHTDSLGLSEQSLLSAIRENVPSKFLDLNLKAFSYFK